jgi:two-component system response regulator ResD
MAKRVLVVDDHPAARSVIRSILETEKSQTYQVTEAATGGDCLKAVAQEGPFDLILLDVKLPDMDGYDVCRAVREVETQVPIVFITGQGDLRDFASGRQAGADSYLVKPVSRMALRSLAQLFTTLHRSQASEDAEPAQ